MTETTDLAIAEAQHIVLMKSGVIHHVKEDTAHRIQEGLVNQSSHSFIRITELAVTINSAEIEGVYTPEKYEEYLRLKGGEYQCAYGRWHMKRDKCICKAELAKERERKLEEIRRREEYKEQTPEQRAKNADAWRRCIEEGAIMSPDSIFRKSFMIGSRDGRKVRRSTIDAFEIDGKTAYLEGIAIEEDV